MYIVYTGECRYEIQEQKGFDKVYWHILAQFDR
jgi:hypothetical protein